MKKLPKYLYRNDDGRLIELKSDNLYYFPPKTCASLGYTYEYLVYRCHFKENLKDCEIKPPVLYKRCGCGDDDD